MAVVKADWVGSGLALGFGCYLWFCLVSVEAPIDLISHNISCSMEFYAACW